MRLLARLTAAMATIGLLAACASPLLSPDDRKQVCMFEVDEQFGRPTFHANPLSNAAGGLVGLTGGALAGLSGGFPGAIITTPLFALIGAGYGAACGAASLTHPAAEADFERLLHAADTGILKRTLEEHLNAPRAECSRGGTESLVVATPDTRIEVETIDAGMGCIFGEQEYWFAVKWRTIRVESGKILNSTTTKCDQKSFRSIDDWFASPDQGRVEIERVLARTGQRMATELLANLNLPDCKLRSRESGEVEER